MGGEKKQFNYKFSNDPALLTRYEHDQKQKESTQFRGDITMGHSEDYWHAVAPHCNKAR
jgi:hypothetical protein